MRVHVVDPSAYTPPYDHALCSALALAGVEVELYTTAFPYGSLPAPAGYARREFFYRRARLVRAQRARRLARLAEHVPDMLRYACAARVADVVHFQWLPVQYIDGHLLPSRSAGGSRRPVLLTAHDILPREPRRGQLQAQRRLYERFDAVIVHSAHGRERLTRELGVAPERVHVIPHGAFAHLADGPEEPPPFASERPVALFFGLLRPYKGLEVLLEAWRGIQDAELWIAGMARMDVARLRAAAAANVRFDVRFIGDAQLRGYFRRADLVVLPYLEIDQSGVLATALAFGKPLLVSDAGAFAEVAATGAAQTVPSGDARALHAALGRLLGDPPALAQMAARARAAAGDEYSWEGAAKRTRALYEALRGEPPASASRSRNP